MGYTHPTIRERDSGRMASAATVPLVPLVLGWGGGVVGAGTPAHRAYGRQDGTELAETDLRVFRQLNAKDCRSFWVEGSLHFGACAGCRLRGKPGLRGDHEAHRFDREWGVRLKA